jgi:hypothetical protein
LVTTTSLIGCCTLFLIAQAKASDITYSLVNDLLTQNQGYGTGAITGTITTDGTLGALAYSDVLSYSLTVAFGSSSQTYTPSNSQLINPADFTGNFGVTATALNLTFAYTAYTGGFGTPNFFEVDRLPEPDVGYYPAVEFFGGNGGGSLHGYNYSTCFECSSFGSYSGSVVIADVAATPLPTTLPLLAAGLTALGLLGRRKSSRVDIAAA